MANLTMRLNLRFAKNVTVCCLGSQLAKPQLAKPLRTSAPVLSSDFICKTSIGGGRHRPLVLQHSRAGNQKAGFATAMAPTVEQLKAAQEDIKALIQSEKCNPILIRLGWHDAGTYDKNVSEWPKCGGANGSLFYDIVQKHAANAGLVNAVNLLVPIKEKYSSISWADLFQMAGACAVEVAGGPHISMKYGRVDISGSEEAVKEGNLPAAAPPSPADHLREVFYRMGLEDKDIVALSGAHTLGRAYPNRSGFGKEATKYTKDGPGTKGGQSWTAEWLKFDNSYFKDVKAKTDEELLVLPTDAALFEDASFKVFAEKYAADQEAFFADYAASHKKLSELGAKYVPAEGIYID